jgi:hydrocephalus-inducing protein
VLEAQLRADVATPLVHFSARTLMFAYLHEPGGGPSGGTGTVLCQPLVLTNTSQVSLLLLLQTQPPFSLGLLGANGTTSNQAGVPLTRSLVPGEQLELKVELDPMHHGGLQTHVARQRLVVTYLDSPSQRDFVELVGDVQFPNIQARFGARRAVPCLQLGGPQRPAFSCMAA